MFIGFPNIPPGECLQGRNLFIRSPNQPPWDCLPGLHPVSKTYLKVHSGDCRPRMQPVYTVSNPTYMGLSIQGAACPYDSKTYLRGTVGWKCSYFIQFLNLYSKSCLDFCHYNTSKPCFCPFVSDIGYLNKYPHFCTCRR